mgnify:CR=1 FL=1
MDDLARAHGEPLFRAGFRVRSSHFRVTEELGFEPSGEGEHDFLRIRKTGANTEWVARRLARVAGVAPRDLGYCGLKDRPAVTTQWFSIPRGPLTDVAELSGDVIEVLEQAGHVRKLRRGSHAGNRFRLRIRRLRVKDLVVPREPSSLTEAREFGFRHVLIRDVAYESLPKRDRAAIHRDIAEWAERLVLQHFSYHNDGRKGGAQFMSEHRHVSFF